jgi:ABC-2 type transport system ATP-binding protein
VATPVVLRARDLAKRYGDLQAVRGVSFEIHEGETYGLLGPNGAGKTTTISIVCGLLTRDGGEVTLDGTPIDVGAVAAKAGIGYVPQDLAIYPDLTARENLTFFGRLYESGAGSRHASPGPRDRGLTARAGDRVDRTAAACSAAQHRRRAAPPAAAPAPRADGRRGSPEPQRDPRSIAALGKTGRPSCTRPTTWRGRRLCDRVGIIDAGETEGTQRLVSLIGQQDIVG